MIHEVLNLLSESSKHLSQAWSLLGEGEGKLALHWVISPYLVRFSWKPQEVGIFITILQMLKQRLWKLGELARPHRWAVAESGFKSKSDSKTQGVRDEPRPRTGGNTSCCGGD